MEFRLSEEQAGHGHSRGFQRDDPRIKHWGEFNMTLDEVAHAMASEDGSKLVTRERIRQLQISGLKKCRSWCQRNGYKIEDLL